MLGIVVTYLGEEEYEAELYDDVGIVVEVVVRVLYRFTPTLRSSLYKVVITRQKGRTESRGVKGIRRGGGSEEDYRGNRGGIAHHG